MVDKLRLYISAAYDLRFERDVLARAIAEIPTSLGWTITQTPGPDQEANLDAVVQADVHLLILGSDIQAPVGLEWSTARRAGKQVSLLYKSSNAPDASSSSIRARSRPLRALAGVRRCL
jgi:hypothetical protein